MADVNAAYRQAWSAANKPKSSGGWLLTNSIRLGIWATCLLNFVSAAYPGTLPQWADNLTLGMTWVFILFLASMGCLVTFEKAVRMFVAYCLSESAANRNPEARKLYASFKGSIASDLRERIGFRVAANLSLVAAQAGLLFAGGAMVAALTLVTVSAWLQLVAAIQRAVTASMMEGVITPETVAWLEAGEMKEPVSA